VKRNQPTIAIAGAGIAGMAAALFLEHAGFRVLVLEKSPSVSTSGTGIQISPNAYKVLGRLGLAEMVSKAGFAPQTIEIGNGITGRPLTSFALGDAMIKRHGAPYTTIHRADLARILQSACDSARDIKLLHGVKAVGMRRGDNEIILLCEGQSGSEEHSAAAAIGADGAWSSLRKCVGSAEQPYFSGHIAWRVILDMDEVGPAVSRTATGLWLAPGCHLVHYPVSGGKFLNIVAITPWNKRQAPQQGWLDDAAGDDRASAYINWHNDLQNLVARRGDWGGWPLFAAPRAGAFTDGLLCLIGDAAHPMVPYGAQGGASALEDACVVAAECSKSPDNLAAAFSRFELRRKPRVQRIMQLSQNNRRIYQMSPPLDSLRNMAMRLSSQETIQKRMDWVYGWTPPSTISS